jgi:magnesium transporter
MNLPPETKPDVSPRTEPILARTEAILRRLVRREAAGALKKLLSRTRPEDIAAAMEHLTWGEQRRLFQMVDDRDAAAELLSHLSDESIREITREFHDEEVVDLLDRLDADDAAEIIEVLPDEIRDRVVAGMDDEAKEDVEELLAWPEDSAGRMMSPDVFQMPEWSTCGECIRVLQDRSEEYATVHYLYVTDRQQRLVGVASLRQLVVHAQHTPLVSVMVRDPIAVAPEADQEEVAKYVARYDLLAIPVIDKERHILGVVTVDDVVDVIREEAAEDMLKMAGLSEDADPSARSLVRQVRQRAGWLLATIFGGILAAEIIGTFEDTLAKVAILAGFIPVVMGMGGNVGIQSATIAVRGLATGHVQLGGISAFVWREVRTGWLLGLLYGGLLAAYAFVRFPEQPGVSVTVGTSISLAIGFASMVGASVPLILDRFEIDPAVATGPLVTTLVDVLGIIIYFNVARFLLGL